ncbi:MAG: MarR family winged helix-turn-helix transcriptional regulator [Microbacterium sp.]|uniref:MarR family winged helix-turn-helix transcriptional regulator n=1 Tax=Microbacterium sp. TaxID=51671 RepID=UPI003F7FA824
MTTTATVPPTGTIDEIAYQEKANELYARLFPDLDSEPYLLGMALQRVAARMRLEMDTEIYQPAGVSIAHVRILIALAAVGPTTPTELARFTQVSPSSVSSVLRTLRKNGHVVVENPDDDSDGRVKKVRLLPAGQAAMESTMSQMRELEENWASPLNSRERQTLLHLLRRMASAPDRS